MLSYLILNILLLIVIKDNYVSARNLTCDKNSEKTADEMFGHMIGYGKNTRKFPGNRREMTEYCSLQLADVKTLEAYTKLCKKGLPKQFFAVMMYTIKSNINRMCKKGSKKGNEFLSATKCLNKASNEFESCHNTMIDNLQGIKSAEDKKKIPYTCCEYYNMRKCFQEKGKNVDICTDKHLETIDDFIESTTTNALNLFCGEYADESDKCDKLGKPPAKKKNQKRTRSISVTIADIFDSFPEI